MVLVSSAGIRAVEHAVNVSKDDFICSVKKTATAYLSVAIFARINATIAHPALENVKIDAFIADANVGAESYVYHVWNLVDGDAIIMYVPNCVANLATEKDVMNHV